ncbi:hypothetical protein [Thetidibacter halocola]|uniref:D-galactarate dehydratase n=1 Tax=Thetidibacter halocola TaxID=2827239 RepID=A0A8J7WDZ6_9RHOB|nr:hypothetical protein [Thetidibacter halocola]MBS0123611.1 hypothetical protein [Thetidibacter halocola]
MKNVPFLCLVLLLGACAVLKAPARPGDTVSDEQTRPLARPAALSAPTPPANARTQEQFDTTTAEQRAAAASAPAAATEQSLGETVVSLGDVARPGFWLETALVSAPAKGRVVYPATGESAQVDLIPIDGGSRLSLAAMRLIGAPLTDLPTVQVYRLP